MAQLQERLDSMPIFLGRKESEASAILSMLSVLLFLHLGRSLKQNIVDQIPVYVNVDEVLRNLHSTERLA